MKKDAGERQFKRYIQQLCILYIYIYIDIYYVVYDRYTIIHIIWYGFLKKKTQPTKKTKSVHAAITILLNLFVPVLFSYIPY